MFRILVGIGGQGRDCDQPPASARDFCGRRIWTKTIMVTGSHFVTRSWRGRVGVGVEEEGRRCSAVFLLTK